jgi:hypothetical protein
MNKPAAIYARVSSDRQKENHTIASQGIGSPGSGDALPRWSWRDVVHAEPLLRFIGNGAMGVIAGSV